MRARYRSTLLILGVAVLLSGCASRQEIRPYPDFIRSGVEPGDPVEIVTTDGREIELEVSALEPDAIVGKDGQRVSFDSIEQIARRSRTELRYPCGGAEPLGCSTPEIITTVSEYHASYAEQFHGECVQHDFCYRHGLATYGNSREDCDTDFYQDMKDNCLQSESMLVKVGKTLVSPACLLAARQMYEAVSRWGADRFQAVNSTYCEYDGPPENRAP